MNEAKILDLPMSENGAEAKTVRDYLKKLLLGVWEKNECFSGKHPFGNSGWEHEIYAALVKGGAIEGTLDEDGWIDTIDADAANKMISKVILTLN